MYEEVCLLCGRPVLADGRAYCSDECENLDITSPSISTTSSAHPSPFLHSTANAPGIIADVPALLPSALGHALDARKSHRVRHSQSSSSNSSTSWSALEDEYEDDAPSPALHGAAIDDEYYTMNTDYLTPDSASKLSHSYATVQRHSLAYVRRPSTTNNRSTIPTLHRRTSSVSTPSSTGVSRSVPYDCPTEDDMSDVPSAPAPSVRSGSGPVHQSEDLAQAYNDESEREKEQETLNGKKRRNRASLPAYFSLLVSTSTTPRSHKGSSALSMLSRSLQNSSSPPTPRIANPVVDMTTAFATAQSSHLPKPHSTPHAAPRGRSRRRDPDQRSSSSRRSPSRSPRPRAHTHMHQSAQARARLDSMEKVADWVAHSPVVAAGVRAARHLTRRNSSPPPLPKYEQMHLRDSGVDVDSGYMNSAVEEDDEEGVEPVEDTRRGRRRVNELDDAPLGVGRNAPGYGNGRSGLVSRERGRVGVVKR